MSRIFLCRQLELLVHCRKSLPHRPQPPSSLAVRSRHPRRFTCTERLPTRIPHVGGHTVTVLLPFLPQSCLLQEDEGNTGLLQTKSQRTTMDILLAMTMTVTGKTFTMDIVPTTS